MIRRQALLVAILFCATIVTSACSAPNLLEQYSNAGLKALSEGNFSEAEELLKQAVRESERAGKRGAVMARNLNNLGSAYFLDGQYEAAEPLYRQSLAIREETLPPDHPDLATSLYNLGALKAKQGNFKEAESLCGRSLDIHQHILGRDHPYVARVLNKYTSLLRKARRVPEAEAIELRVKPDAGWRS